MAAREQLYDTFFPYFGSGAPSAAVPTSRPYYDTGTSPYTPYIYAPGVGWVIYSPPNTPIDATSLQGVAVSATPPTNGQLLQYNSGTTEYEPT